MTTNNNVSLTCQHYPNVKMICTTMICLTNKSHFSLRPTVFRCIFILNTLKIGWKEVRVNQDWKIIATVNCLSSSWRASWRTAASPCNTFWRRHSFSLFPYMRGYWSCKCDPLQESELQWCSLNYVWEKSCQNVFKVVTLEGPQENVKTKDIIL